MFFVLLFSNFFASTSKSILLRSMVFKGVPGSSFAVVTIDPSSMPEIFSVTSVMFTV